MSDDLLQRLRGTVCYASTNREWPNNLLTEAADEIEGLREARERWWHDGAKDEIERLRAENKRVNKDRGRLRNKLADAEEQLTRLFETEYGQRGEIEQLRDDNIKLRHSRKATDDRLGTLQARVAELEQCVASHDEHTQRITYTNAEFAETIHQLRAALKEAGNRFGEYGDHVYQAGCYAVANGETWELLK